MCVRSCLYLASSALAWLPVLVKVVPPVHRPAQPLTQIQSNHSIQVKAYTTLIRTNSSHHHYHHMVSLCSIPHGTVSLSHLIMAKGLGSTVDDHHHDNGPRHREWSDFDNLFLGQSAKKALLPIPRQPFSP